MSGAHTPGPWHVGAQNDSLFIHAGHRPAVNNDWPDHAAHRPLIAAVYVTKDATMANARLIAAAPRLLAALVGAVASWDRLYDQLPVSQLAEDAEFGSINEARGAIAEAWGIHPWEVHARISATGQDGSA